MGRGDRRSAAGDVPGDVETPRRYPVVIANEDVRAGRVSVDRAAATIRAPGA